jgi:tetratricopeptide (TPR) repeat protein
MSNVNQQIDEAILAIKEEDDYLRALTIFLDVYGGEDPPSPSNAKAAGGLSWFALCLALVQKKYKPAIELGKRAVALQFYNPDHWVNLTKVYAAAGQRKKAVEIAETGLKQHPESEALLAARASLGVRARPAVPFLDRAHPINVTLGQARHAKKFAEKEGRKRK